MSGGNSVLSRRSFVAKLAAGGAAVAATTAIGRASAATTRADSSEQLAPNPHTEASEAVVDATPPSSPPWELLRPLALGSAVAEGWHIAGLSGADAGSCVVTLQNPRGRAHRIHLCRNDGQPQGLVHTRRFDLLVMNGGAGDLPTEEGLAQAVAAVAHAVAANEGTGNSEQLVSALLPQAERVARYSDGRQLR